ncbi:hypothetical protein FHS57_005704 [Runella defluvii]|uniref:Uncharacterized protein n=1 Tax=Runella defluvii TaxID=370973 RepID=A0A7W5ZS04_9BACT|nr:hypothetical protein [Runella defluvii]
MVFNESISWKTMSIKKGLSRKFVSSLERNQAYYQIWGGKENAILETFESLNTNKDKVRLTKNKNRFTYMYNR